jgi:hypothetical protein
MVITNTGGLAIRVRHWNARRSMRRNSSKAGAG